MPAAEPLITGVGTAGPGGTPATFPPAPQQPTRAVYEIYTRAGTYPFARNGLLRGYDRFGYTRRYQTNGEFAFTIGSEKPEVTSGRCLTGNIIEVTRNGVTDFTGYVMGHRRTFDQKAPQSSLVEVKGLDLTGWLLRQRCAVPPGTFQYYGNQGAAEVVMQNAITDHFVNPTDSARIVANLALGPLHDPALGQTVVINLHGEKWSDAMGQIALAGEVGYQVTLNGVNTLEFDVYVGYDRSVQGGAAAQPVIFNPNFRDLTSFIYEIDLTNLENHVYTMGGDGTAASRFTVEDQDPASQGMWGRFEAFQDGMDAYNAAIAHTEGAIYLAPKTLWDRLSFIPRDTSANSYKTHWDLGDTVTVRFDDWGVYKAVPLVEIKVTLQAQQLDQVEVTANLLPHSLERMIRGRIQALERASFAPQMPALADGRIALAPFTSAPTTTNALTPLAAGQMIWNSTTNTFQVYDGSAWRTVTVT